MNVKNIMLCLRTVFSRQFAYTPVLLVVLVIFQGFDSETTYHNITFMRIMSKQTPGHRFLEKSFFTKSIIIYF